MTRDTRAQLSSTIAPSEDRSKKQNFLDPVVLAARVKEISKILLFRTTPRYGRSDSISVSKHQITP